MSPQGGVTVHPERQLMDLSRDDILAILEVLERTNFAHFELRVGDTVITAGTSADHGRLAFPRSGGLSAQDFAARPGESATTSSANNAVPAPEGRFAADSQGPPDVPDTESDLVDVVAPIVGAFYSCPEPGAPPFVEVGSQITVGETLALLEVMKMFNAVTAEVAGTVAEILIKDGEFVEFGQPLMRVRTGAG